MRTLSDAFVFDCRGDMRELHPTIVIAVPAVYEKIRKGILSQVHKRSIFARMLFHTLLHFKYRFVGKLAYLTLFNENLGRLRHTKTARVISWILDKVLFHSIQESVGGRVKRFISGGASLSYTTQRFFTTVFSVPVVVGYGALFIFIGKFILQDKLKLLRLCVVQIQMIACSVVLGPHCVLIVLFVIIFFRIISQKSNLLMYLSLTTRVPQSLTLVEKYG